MKKHILTLPIYAIFGLFGADNALAQQYRSEPWQFGFQKPGSPIAERIFEFHDMLLGIEVAIVIFVMLLMAYIAFKFNAKANPTPTKTTHNNILEVLWTALPILILVIIAIPSLKILYFIDHTEEPEMTLKVIGNQWYWSYAYPDQGNFEFDSIILEDDELLDGQPRMLSVDNPVVLPVDTNIRILLVSNDVIHNFAVPSLGLKLDTTPGRTNETWVKINEPGSYYGMCSELCGINHGFMPVHVVALSKEDFAIWSEGARLEFASGDVSDTLQIATVITE